MPEDVPTNSTPLSRSSRATPSRRVFWLLPIALLPLPLFLNQYHQYVVNLMLVYIPVGIGFNVVVGNLGQLAFSNVAFFGIGAYTSGILMLKLGFPWWATIIPAGVIGGLAVDRPGDHERRSIVHVGDAPFLVLPAGLGAHRIE